MPEAGISVTQSPATFDAAAAIAWLTSSRVVGSDGAVASWVNPAHRGYAYPEAAGLLLRLLAQRNERGETAYRVARWLGEAVAADRIGRDGRKYLFDLGVALAGLLAWTDLLDASRSPLVTAVASLNERIASGSVIEPPGGDLRWSTRFGPHMLKLAVALRLLDRIEGGDVGLRAVEALLSRVPAWPGMRAPSDPGGPTYLHAHAYAMEGLLVIADERRLEPATRRDARQRAERGIGWLARIQRDDGSIPAHHDGRRAEGPGRADTTAQAIRLWCCLDRTAFDGPIDRALTYLHGLTEPEGGLRYDDQSDDINTWATIFAVQALAFVDGDADPEALL